MPDLVLFLFVVTGGTGMVATVLALLDPDLDILFKIFVGGILGGLSSMVLLGAFYAIR